MFKLKNLYGEWYKPHESFVVRNPLFPIETFFNWKSDPGADAASAKEQLRESLKEFYRLPVAKEALYIGSPDLYDQLLLWLDNKIEKPDKKEKAELALAKYMIRMCTRCTPYGLFASCTSGKAADESGIDLGSKNSVQRFGRLDMDYVCQVHSHLLMQKDISDQLCFYPNSSLYPLGNYLRYIEHRFSGQAGRSYHLVQIEQSGYLEKVLQFAKHGGSPDELAATITDEKISHDEAVEFVYELITGQVLVSEIEPGVTGDEYFRLLLKKLKTLRYTETLVEHFEKVIRLFDGLKEPSEDDKRTFYVEIAELLRQLPVPVQLKTLVQVDSYRPAAACTINKKVIDEILAGSSLMQLLTSDVSVHDSFADFKTAFLSRYESQWMPLVEVLDTESGIGFGKFATSGMEESPLIDKLPIGKASENTMHYAATESFKWQLYHEALTEGKTEVVLTAKTLETLGKKEASPAGLPDSICMLARVHAKSPDDVDNGNYTVTLLPPSGPSGGNLLGRFCHLDTDIKNFTESILANEEAHHEDCIFAEIVHLPESRVGNILMRPVLRNYEIPYLCGSTVDAEHQIPVTDLMVGIENSMVVLRSRRLNKEVVPRMTTAHNYANTTLPIYQFLCELQHQQIRTIGWQWGVLENSPFLPRVSYGKYILSKARWNLAKDDIKDCDDKNDDRLLVNFSALVKKHRLPEYVLLSSGDNELMLHLQNIFCIRLLLSEILKSGSVTLTETLDTPGQCWMKSDDGFHAGEIIIAFDRNKTPAAQIPGKKIIKEERRPIKRYFPAGSEWLYAKIYCGTRTGEKILCDVLKPLTEELIADQLIDSFFFLRYYEQGEHIRVRFHNSSDKNFWKHVLHTLKVVLQPYVNNHSVHKLQFETYQREIERYGFDTIELSETLFYHQSSAILNFMSMLSGDEGEQYRWQVALKAMDMMLDDFHYKTEQKRDLLKILHESFSEEFKVGAPGQKKISERYGSSKQLIQRLMNNEFEEDENMEAAVEVFRMDTVGYRATVAGILSAPSIDHDIKQLNGLMSSYLHMFINRLFVSNQRKIELVIYDYLLKYYESKIAREKNNKATVTILQPETADL